MLSGDYRIVSSIVLVMVVDMLKNKKHNTKLKYFVFYFPFHKLFLSNTVTT